MKSDLISIIIPVYNTEKYLKKCIESIIGQTHKNLQIIIVNDGSTDNSDLLIKELMKTDKRIEYIKIDNHGVSYARNCGLKKVNGEFIMFIDSDDVIDSRMCEILLNNMNSNKADLSVCGYEVINSQNLLIDSSNNVRIIDKEKYEYLFNIYKGYLWNKMYRKEIIDRYELRLNEEIFMCEDLLFNFFYLEHSSKIVYVDTKLYGYLIADSNSSIKVNKKWFSILLSYNYIFANISSYDIHLQNLIALNFLYTLFEARVRCEILNLSFFSVCEEYKVDYQNVISYFKKILKDKLINSNHKTRLVLLYNFYWITKEIKKRKILKG